MLPSEWSRYEEILELEPLGFKFVSHVYPAGTRFPLKQLTTSFTLVVSGWLTCDALGTRLTRGEVLEPQGRYLAQTPLQLWQITGTEVLIANLRRFALKLLQQDHPTAVHSVRVGLLAREMGQFLRLDVARLDTLSLAAYLHDLGKLELPSQLLRSPKKLNLSQWQFMVKHPLEGSRLLGGTPLARLGPILEQHHERLDGSGYPYGLTGKAISLEASIVAVADTFDAITHARPYQTPRSVQQALSEINRYREVLYPGEAVEALNRVISRT